MKRSPLTRKTPMKRTGKLKRKRGFHGYLGFADFNDAVWKRDLGRSIISKQLVRYGTPAHHAIPKRTLRQSEITYPYIYDPRIGVTLTAHEHELVELGHLKIWRSSLPACFFEAAEEMGMMEYVDRKYPTKED